MIGEVRRLGDQPRGAMASPHLWGVVLSGASSVLARRTVERTATIIPRRRILTVTARPHPGRLAAAMGPPSVQRVVQPAYRGSAAEIFLPVLKIARRDPHATVLIVPGDLPVGHEARFVGCVERAVGAVDLRPDVPILLGARPRTLEAGHGWIEPGVPVDGLERLAVRTIARFVERPSRAEVGALFEGHGLRNTRVIVARARTLIELGQRHLPDVLETLEPLEAAFGRPEEALLCDAVYEHMPRASVWRALLHGGDVAVLEIPDLTGSREAPSATHALAS
jgi:mannose-1-phosphate guanylyltransferase